MATREIVAHAVQSRSAGPLRRPIADVVDAEYAEAPSIDVRDYLRVLYQYRWLAGTCFGLTLALATVATLLTTRTYTATTRIQVARQSPIQLQLEENVLKVDGDERANNGASTFLSTQVAILRSRDLAEGVIREQHLDTSDLFRGRSGRDGVLAVGGRLLNLFRPRGWDLASDTDARDAGGEAPEASAADLSRYLGYLSVNEVRGTDLLDISFTTPSAQLSAFLAAAHTQAYMAANDEARLATNVTAKAFLGEQLKEARDRLDRGDAALREFAQQHPQVAIDREHQVVSERMRQLTEELTKVEGQRVAVESRYDFLVGPDGDPTAYFLDKAGVQKIRLALLDVQTQQAVVADRLGGNHPEMIALREQQATLTRQLGAEVQQETRAVRARHEALRLRQDRLAGKLDEEEQQAIALQALGARYALLKKDVETAQALRDSLLKQQMETAVNSELAASNVRLVDRAELPTSPSKPNVPLNLTLGAFVGLLLAVGATLAVEYFDSSVKNSDDVENVLQLATLATIPSLSGRGRAAAAAPGTRAQDLVVHRAPRSLVAEAFRALRTAVLFSTAGAPPRVILVTSAGAGEGKTMTSLNLATTLAASGSQVALVDADLRRPSVHRAFALANDDGLSTYLAGHEDEPSSYPSEVPNLCVIPAGPTPPNPAELVGSARMRALLERLRERFDFVIVDSPPTLPVTDAVLVAREADGVVLVVKGHDTPRELVRRARDQLAGAGVTILGALINNVNAAWGTYYHYDRYYGAYYGVQRDDEAEA